MKRLLFLKMSIWWELWFIYHQGSKRMRPLTASRKMTDEAWCDAFSVSSCILPAKLGLLTDLLSVIKSWSKAFTRNGPSTLCWKANADTGLQAGPGFSSMEVTWPEASLHMTILSVRSLKDIPRMKADVISQPRRVTLLRWGRKTIEVVPIQIVTFWNMTMKLYLRLDNFMDEGASRVCSRVLTGWWRSSSSFVDVRQNGGGTDFILPLLHLGLEKDQAICLTGMMMAWKFLVIYYTCAWKTLRLDANRKN